MNSKKIETDFAGEKLTLETGKMAGLAQGAVTVRLGDTIVLASACIAEEPKEGADFFPLLVDYEERLYAAGKISGSRFIKREGRPSDQAVLTARLIDRPIRPLFPKSYRNDVQVVITALSVDLEHEVDIAALIGASTSLLLAGAPFSGPVAAVRVALINGDLVINPKASEIEKSKLDLVVAGTKEKVMMLEAKASEVSEEIILEGIKNAQEAMQPALKIQKDLAREAVRIEPDSSHHDKVTDEVAEFLGDKLADAVHEIDESRKQEKLLQFEKQILENFEGSYKQVDLKSALDTLIAKEIRKAILEKGKRPDGRKLSEIRPISAEVGLLPRTHGSALFSRGQTQSLTIVTLGSPGEEQVIETMETEGTKRFMHHYNFPPYSTGEIRPMRSVSRREIGHGSLAEHALLPVIPDRESFPYTIRLVSEILSSDGSSSMAATCGCSLALMDAGVPIKTPVVGVAIGLISDESGKKSKILTDIRGLEDFYGDMDFKVAGTAKGITVIQLDIKLFGIDMGIIKEALEAAKKARIEILAKLNKVIKAPRSELSPYAPRIEKIKINKEKIADVIGPGGKMINKIIEEAGGKEVTSIDIEEDGTILVCSTEPEKSKKAIAQIESITREVQVGEIFQGEVSQIVKDRRSGKEIGAIVKLSPHIDGMVHISEVADRRIGKVSDVLKIGDVIPVKVLDIDREKNRISLSHKRAKKQ